MAIFEKGINLVLLGFGNVSKEFIRQFNNQKPNLHKQKLFLKIAAVFNSKGGWVPGPRLSQKSAVFQNPRELMSRHGKKEGLKIIFIDMSNSEIIAEFLYRQYTKGFPIVLSNKRPLCTPLSVKHLDLHKNNIFYETTVGAGLPVIYTIKSLLASGDRNIEIAGNFSGTLGFIMSELEKGSSFSSAVKKAKDLGFTETDPREDLRGTDVARKILILARTLGRRIDFSDVKVRSLYPEKYDGLTVRQFMDELKNLDKFYSDRIKNAKNSGKTVRYVGFIDKNRISAGLIEVDRDSDLGNLQGPDNLIVIKSDRYRKHPLVIKGPGAGAGVTAAGVLNDVISAAKLM